MEKITTKQAFSLLTLINKMNLRNKLMEMVKQQTKVENRKQVVLNKLYAKSNSDTEITEEIVVELFNKNVELYEEYKALEELQNECGMEFLFDIVESLPSAEKEFYKAAASIFDTTVKDIEERDVLEVIGDIVNIFKSESFLGFFKSMSK